MTKILYAGTDEQWSSYKTHMDAALDAAGINIQVVNSAPNPEEISYILYAPNGPLQDFTPYKNVKLVQSLWAGVEMALANKTLRQPLARMVETGMSQGMADYTMAHILRHHLNIDKYSFAKPGDWDETPPALSSDTTVAFLGLGALGGYCASKSAQFGFHTIGWSRRLKEINSVETYAGDDGLEHVLKTADILVLLLPNTPQTTAIINAQSLETMKPSACIINPGRGPLIDDDALLNALDKGQIGAATLDVFDTEPLPTEHRYWTHPKVLVTPHVASATRIDTACDIVVDNIKRGEAGAPFLHLVDRDNGY